MFDLLSYLERLFYKPTPMPINSTSYSILKPEYASMFQTAKVNNLTSTDEIVDEIVKYKSTYQEVGIAPWYLIGILHHMECDQDFNTHLFNGDPLTHRTVDDPVGQPTAPPDLPNGSYSWVFSAQCALKYDNWNTWPDWSMPGALYKMEAYNGWGYRVNHNMFSPYLWSGTQFYTKGKYSSDGQFDPSEVSEQTGCVPILLRLQQRNLLV